MGLTDKHLAYGDDIPQTQAEKDYYWKINCQQPCDVSKLTQKAYEDGKKDGYVQAKVEQLNCDDCISRQAVLDINTRYYGYMPNHINHEIWNEIMDLPSVTPKEKTGHCKDCKWWKDNDGVYRRGVGAESKCPINRKEVYEGDGYCFMFEP